MSPQRTWSVPVGTLDDARRGIGRDVVRTVCGREFTVSDLRLERLAHPAARVSLSTRPLPQDTDTLWASLTADEARRLAAHLLAHAAAAEAATTSAMTATTPAATPAARIAPPLIEADYIDSRRYVVRLGERHLLIDPLGDATEQDAAADLLAASLTVELARRAERFLARHEVRRDGLRVCARRGHGESGSRTLAVTVITPPSLTAERKNALRALLTRSVLRDRLDRRLAIEIDVA